MLSPLKIGHVQLANNLFLAPIAGYCDVSYRLIARSFGHVGLACTDLLSPEGILRQTANTLVLTATCDEDKPLAMQLYGSATDRMCEAARWAEDNGADIIDINMGCPVDKVTKKDGGSKLLCNPDNTLRMVEKIKASLRRCPLTCKLRLGWDDTCIVAPSMARQLEDAGVSLVTIHGRTTEMRFSGQARLDGIAEVVAAVKHIPVIGNGDIRTPQEAEHMFKYTKCAGIMIGRGALSAPWIFRDIASYLTTGVIPPPPTIQEKVDAMRRHFYNLCKYRNERGAVMELRKRVSWYAKNMHPCAILKERVRLINSAAEFDKALNDFLEWREQRDREVGQKHEPVPDELAEVA
ncbi:tRNA dihydrouridine synthase DusB [Humisphaera borealis]|uniref:tRNA-dihydrouridine synthase n=1 Tax=Humisphaera borealis TaxID=2807512 RepID=A0A7M2WYK2_9BACT|nr:tRNA dihydrouridine synthase DusB [Humisphaera borealis]QOV90546.1 tRNA dihydrouridine synthase DusB [Humisphaera borealis]